MKYLNLKNSLYFRFWLQGIGDFFDIQEYKKNWNSAKCKQSANKTFLNIFVQRDNKAAYLSVQNYLYFFRIPARYFFALHQFWIPELFIFDTPYQTNVFFSKKKEVLYKEAEKWCRKTSTIDFTLIDKTNNPLKRIIHPI